MVTNLSVQRRSLVSDLSHLTDSWSTTFNSLQVDAVRGLVRCFTDSWCLFMVFIQALVQVPYCFHWACASQVVSWWCRTPQGLCLWGVQAEILRCWVVWGKSWLPVTWRLWLVSLTVQPCKRVPLGCIWGPLFIIYSILNTVRTWLRFLINVAWWQQGLKRSWYGIVIKCMSMTMINFGHFNLTWISLV